MLKSGSGPCGKDCKDRQVGCHCTCTKYIEWKQQYEEQRKQMYAVKKEATVMDAYHRQRKVHRGV